MLAVVSGSGYATYTILAKRMLRRGHAPERVMAAAFSLGAVLLLPVLVLGDTAWIATPDGLAMALFLGAVPTALAYVLFARGLRELTPGETATLTLAEPLTATGARRARRSASAPARSPRSARRSCSPGCSRSRCPPAGRAPRLAPA